MDFVGPAIAIALMLGIYFSYRLFMRGDTAKDRVRKLLPPEFKPDIAHRKGDTYVGYEKSSDRLVLIDWPHSKILSPKDIRGIQPVSESMLGVKHHWLAVDVNPTRFMIWFQYRRAPRDLWRDRLADLKKH